jgi:hypothetical protein
MSDALAQARTMTFDELVELYEKDPVSFLETILPGRYELPVSNECSACACWDRITRAKPRHITRKNHDQDGQIPRPHRFQSDSGFFLVQHLSEEQLFKLAARYRRRRHGAGDEHAGLLDLYRREKFTGKQRGILVQR